MDIPKILQELGIGLSRAIRYSFPGVLLLCTATIVEPCYVKSIYEIGWQLLTFVTLVIGIGLYTTHRSLIIPIHHLLGLFLLCIGDKCCRTKPATSLSPTRWLRSMGIPRFRRMLAYGELRRYWFTKEGEKEAFDVLHAENGLSVMISEAIIAAAIYSWLMHDKNPKWPIICGVILFLLSALSAIQQHRIECAHFKTDLHRAKKIIKKFKKKKGP